MKMYAMLCLFGLAAGCTPPEPEPLTPDQYKAQYEARQAVVQAAANAKNNENKVIIPKGPDVKYQVELTIICLQGIQYYYQREGPAVWLAPVAFKNYSYPFKECR